MAKTKPRRSPHVQYLWPTPILVRRFGQHQRVNRELLELFYAHRRKHQSAPSPVYSSADDLLQQHDHPALGDLTKFIVDSIYEIASEVNAPYWQGNQEIRVHLTGLWFQITNGHGFHETHVHGNCSWSGVYYVQTGECTSGRGEAGKAMPNGITRFYGPNLDAHAGGHVDLGNLYLVQDAAWDSYPQAGNVVVFPAHVKHMAFPYAGEQDRVIVSFHGQVHGAPLRHDYSFS